MRAIRNSSLVRRAFTLMELLIVVAIMAVIAGSMIATYEGTAESAASQIVPHELLQLKQAILRFKQDTGYLPGQGPFNCSTLGVINPEGTVDPWLHSPANFYQLFANPLGGTAHPLATWDPTTRRGWNGPYLALQGNGQVYVPANWWPNNSITVPPGYGTTVVPVPVHGVADPHVAESDGSCFVWSSGARQGRPYLLLQDSNYLPTHQTTIAAKVGSLTSHDDSLLICLGPDGQLGTPDDVTVFLFR